MKAILAKFPVMAELISFFWHQKLWWMLPMIFVLLGMGMLMIFAQSSAIAPFIYTLF